MNASADLSPLQENQIEHLKAVVRESDCSFIRNGINYEGHEAVTHIQRKQDYFDDEIDSTEDFIRLAATKSEISGQYYAVTCDGVTEKLGDWLKSRLDDYADQAAGK